MLKKSLLLAGSLAVLLNTGCSLGMINDWLQPVDSVMQLLDLMKAIGIIC